MTRPLPGWSFMLVGLAVMGYSRFIEAKQPSANLSIFFWVGALLVLFGFAREVLNRRGKKPATEAAHPPARKEPQQHQPHPAMPQHGQHATHQHVRPAQHPSHPHEAMKPCPRCHQQSRLHAKFCHQCGHQFY